MLKTIHVRSTGESLSVSPLTLQEFASLGIFAGNAEKAFAEWKARNHFVELSDFDADDIELLICPKLSYDWDKIQFRVMGKDWVDAKLNWISGYSQVVDV